MGAPNPLGARLYFHIKVKSNQINIDNPNTSMFPL
jgi:hypothetical protein